MCGRYTNTKSEKQIRKTFKLKEGDGLLSPRYNIAPTQLAPVVTNEQSDDIQLFTWGLIPHWAKDKSIGNKMINARAETLHEKPSFREALKKRRCLVLADSFYEWAELRKGRGREPQRISLSDESEFAFAGLWEKWKSPGSDETVFSFTIITTAANALLKPIHDRMPVILTPETAGVWLDLASSSAAIAKLFEPFAEERLKFYAVSTAVNSPQNDCRALIEPVAM